MVVLPYLIFTEMKFYPGDKFKRYETTYAKTELGSMPVVIEAMGEKCTIFTMSEYLWTYKNEVGTVVATISLPQAVKKKRKKKAARKKVVKRRKKK